jgi:hypothetical protein
MTRPQRILQALDDVSATLATRRAFATIADAYGSARLVPRSKHATGEDPFDADFSMSLPQPEYMDHDRLTGRRRALRETALQWCRAMRAPWQQADDIAALRGLVRACRAEHTRLVGLDTAGVVA